MNKLPENKILFVSNNPFFFVKNKMFVKNKNSFSKDISFQLLLKYTNSKCNVIIIIQLNDYLHHFLKLIETPHYPEQCATLNQT